MKVANGKEKRNEAKNVEMKIRIILRKVINAVVITVPKQEK